LGASSLFIVKTNQGRIEVVAKKLSLLGLESALRMEELDPQFQAIKLITSRMSFGSALTLTTLNSIISYRLSGRGEDYWNEFALYVSKASEPKSLIDAVKLVTSFLTTSKINVALRTVKVSRLLRASVARVLEPSRIVEQTSDLRNFAKELAASLKSKWSSKTIVFSLKMICYAYRAYYGKPIIAPFNIPIPVDSRIAKISWASGIAEIEGRDVKSWSDVIKVITSKPRNVQRAWSLIAKRCRMPPLHLDSILWLVGGFIVKGSSRDDAVEKASKALSRLVSRDVNEVFTIVSELITRYL